MSAALLETDVSSNDDNVDKIFTAAGTVVSERDLFSSALLCEFKKFPSDEFSLVNLKVVMCSVSVLLYGLSVTSVLLGD